MHGPVFEAMSIQYESVVFTNKKVDIDEVPEIEQLLGVWALPTFAFLRRGQKISSFTGANERLLRQGLENDGNVGYCSSCSIS